MLIVVGLKVQTLKCLYRVQLQTRDLISSVTYLLKKNSCFLLLRHSSDFSIFFFFAFQSET